MGSVVGVKTGQQATATDTERRKIMLAAHLDEIGAIVTQIDQGFLRFTQIGGLDDRVLMGQEVTVHGQRALPGIIGSIPPHLLPADQPHDTVDQAYMHIDVGLPSRQVEKLVQVGDLVSFARAPDLLLNDLISGKAMDNRASMAAMIVCLRELTKVQHEWDVYAVATADEEWGGFVGATTQAYAIQPDVAVALDVTFADVEEIEVKLDAGPVIGLGPSNHPVVRERLLQICQDLELKHQSEVMPSGAGTDAYAIEISREGIPTILISLPSRYMHSPVEVVQPKDVERIGRLLAHFIARLDESFVDELTPN
jgi:endoglucanase